MYYLCNYKKRRDLRDNFRARERQLSGGIRIVRVVIIFKRKD